MWYKPLHRYKGRSKLEAKWHKGLWLGTARDSNEMLIGTSTGVTRAYAAKRLPKEERWDKDRIRQLQGTPQQPDPVKAGISSVEKAGGGAIRTTTGSTTTSRTIAEQACDHTGGS